MQIGHKLRGGEVIELVSDLGGGKTVFVRGLAQGMGSTDPVSSPSFTLNNQYKAGKLTLHHFDLYRLPEPGLVKHELAEILQDTNVAVAIEWANTVHSILPSERLTIRIVPVTETARRFEFSCPDKLSYLFPANT